MKEITNFEEFSKLSIEIKQVKYSEIIYTRHKNPDGSVGGFVAKTAKVETTVFVSGNARVYDNARVSGNAQVSDNAHVSGTAHVSGNARVYGDARVSGNAWVSGNAHVYGDARVYGNAQVSGNAHVYGNARVSGDKIITILKTIQVFQYCISITPNYVFCGCEKWKHIEIKKLIYEKSKAKKYMTKQQFEILKKVILEIIKY